MTPGDDAGRAPALAIMTALRWPAVLPAAACGGVLARLLAVSISHSASIYYADPGSMVARVIAEWAGGVAMGVAAVYLGAITAPSHRAVVAVALAGLVLVVAGVSLLAGVIVGNGWTLFGAIALISGAVATAGYLWLEDRSNAPSRRDR